MTERTLLSDLMLQYQSHEQWLTHSSCSVNTHNIIELFTFGTMKLE